MDRSSEGKPLITTDQASELSRKELAKVNPDIYGEKETRTYKFDDLPPSIVRKYSGMPEPKKEPSTRTYQFDNLPPTVVKKGSGTPNPKQENPIKVQ